MHNYCVILIIDSLQSPIMEHQHGKEISGHIVKAKPVQRVQIKVIDDKPMEHISGDTANFETVESNTTVEPTRDHQLTSQVYGDGADKFQFDPTSASPYELLLSQICTPGNAAKPEYVANPPLFTPTPVDATISSVSEDVSASSGLDGPDGSPCPEFNQSPNKPQQNVATRPEQGSPSSLSEPSTQSPATTLRAAAQISQESSSSQDTTFLHEDSQG